MIGERNFSDCGYFTLADLRGPLDIAELFDREAPVELEIGAGRGDFMVEYAGAHPEMNLVAVERKLVVLRKIVTKVRRAELPNVRVLNVEVRHFVREYVGPNSFQAVHVYFPDPWPKKRHARRRLMESDDNIGLITRCIAPGGFLHFRTDVPRYYAAAMRLMDARADLQRVEPPAELLAIKTGYERRFHAEGTATNAASYQKLG